MAEQQESNLISCRVCGVIMVKIAKEVDENPDIILKAPNDTPIKKVDETLAARKPDLKFEMEDKNEKN